MHLRSDCAASGAPHQPCYRGRVTASAHDHDCDSCGRRPVGSRPAPTWPSRVPGSSRQVQLEPCVRVSAQDAIARCASDGGENGPHVSVCLSVCQLLPVGQNRPGCPPRAIGSTRLHYFERALSWRPITVTAADYGAPPSPTSALLPGRPQCRSTKHVVAAAALVAGCCRRSSCSQPGVSRHSLSRAQQRIHRAAASGIRPSVTIMVRSGRAVIMLCVCTPTESSRPCGPMSKPGLHDRPAWT